MLMFFCLLGLAFLGMKRKELVVYWCSSPQSCCLKQNFNWHREILLLKIKQMFSKCFSKESRFQVIQKKNAARFAHVQFDSISFYLFFGMELKDANGKSNWNNLVFWDQWELMSDLNVSHGEMSKKLRNSESHWDIFKIMFLDKEDMTSDLNISSGKMSDFIHFYCLGVRYGL